MLTLFLIRGVPGSGKSSLAENMATGLNLQHYEADDYFMQYDDEENCVYKFDALQLSDAHMWCQDHVQNALQNGESVVVSNTSTTEKEVEVYRKIAEKYDARFVSIIVENRHGGKSIHNVPEEKIQQMKNRFSVKL